MKTTRISLAVVAVLGVTLAYAQQTQQVIPKGSQEPSQTAAQQFPSLAPLVESVKAAVVNVDIAARGGGRGGQSEMFDRFFGQRPPGEEPIRQGMGSGVLIDPNGTILTNNHVVEGAVSIQVRLDDGRSFAAEILGRDPLTDLAVIKLKGKHKDLPFVKLGDSDALRVGDWALAIGNPFGLASSVSLGIISAKARTLTNSAYDEFIQTDAAINPGNSGGPLFNLKGEVIGINTAIVGGGAGGIGFAVPSNLARALIPMLEKEGVVSRGYLGVNIQDLTPALAEAMGVPVKEGAIVLSVTEDSPARKAGVLKPDDVIVSVDGEKVESGTALTRLVALKRPGTAVSLGYYRGTKKGQGKITLGTRPDLEQFGLNPRRNVSDDSDDERQRRIGLSIQDVDPRYARQGLPAQGALISEVMPSSPADHAELMRGMVIVEADRKPVRSAADLMKILKAAKPGEQVLLRFRLPGSSAAGLRVLTMPAE